MKTARPPLALALGVACLLLLPLSARADAPPAEILTANYLRYLLFNHVQVQGQQLVDDAPALHQPGLQTRLDHWLDAYQNTIRDHLETRFPGDARNQFEEYIHCFTRAEQDNDLAYLEQLADAVGWPGPAAEGYGAFRRWGIDRWVAGDMQNGVDFLATLSRTIDHLEDTPAPSDESARPSQPAQPAPPPRPANPLRDAEAEPAPFEATDAPAGAPLQQFSAMREQRRQKALEDAHAGMAQIAAERDAWEQEYAANKEAKAQAEAQAMQAQAARLAATDEEALEQRKNSFRSRAINVVAGVASSTVGAFTGAIAGRAADEAVHSIFDRK
ncbi:MAG: hypothetical protein GX803_02465 [Lentisphaerae bacterium]|nr:hypothetical protein [Lentisphaerota bacterium]